MSPSKRRASQPTASNGLRGPLWWLLGYGRPALILLLVVGLFGGGWYVAWKRIGPRVLASPEYRVGLAQVEITPLPPWIHHKSVGDFRAEVFRDPTLAGPLSVMDDDLTERIKKAFELHPWVSKVVGVAKRHPASVTVDLAYRRPVCMVEFPDVMIPVDADGVLLPPEGFSPIEARSYPRLLGVARKPLVAPGRHWDNATVVGGAEIAAALGPVWERTKLDCLVPAAADVRSPRHEPTFTLVAHGGTRIFWGYAPGANVLGEIPAAEKVARLQNHWAKYDMFNDRHGKPQELDIRNMGASLRP